MTFDERADRGEALIRSAQLLANRALDDLTPFLRLMGRFPGMSAANLLLTAEQYPSARVLGRASFWQQMFANTPGELLRPEWAGKGIDLVLPGFDGSNMRLCAVLYYADGQMAQPLSKDILPRCPSLVDIQERAEENLLRAGVMVNPDEPPELFNDQLDAGSDDEAHDAAARLEHLLSLYFQGEEAVSWAAELMPAIACTALIQGAGHRGVTLSRYGLERVKAEAGDEALPLLDRVQRLYLAFYTGWQSTS